MVLDTGGDHVVALARQPEDSQVVRFGAAAGENDLRVPAPEQHRNRLPCALHGRPRFLPVMVDRRGIPEMLAEVGLHGLKNLGQHGRGRVVVEIDSLHGSPTSLPFYDASGSGRRGRAHLTAVAAQSEAKLEARVTQSWVVFGTAPERPAIFAIGFQNEKVVD